MKPSVYIETSVISHLTARTSPLLRTAAMQQATAEWWERARGKYRLVTSELVLMEAGRGDAGAAADRLAALTDIPLLPVSTPVVALARHLLNAGALPEKAKLDATHVALAAIGDIDYLLTWNCQHINNPRLKPIMRSVCAVAGVRCPEICTPDELLERNDDE